MDEGELEDEDFVLETRGARRGGAGGDDDDGDGPQDLS
jgi:hypothetical protein